VTGGWQPTTDLERALLDAVERSDHDAYFRLLSAAELLVPVTTGPSGTSWVTSTVGDRTFLLAFTSAEALGQSAGGAEVRHHRIGFVALARAWPHREWWLAVDPGAPVETHVPPTYLAAVAANGAPPTEPAQPTQPVQPTQAARPAPSTQQVPAQPVQPAEPASPTDQVQPTEAALLAAAASELPPLPRPKRTGRRSDSFQPANEVEHALLGAAAEGDTDGFLKATLLAEVVVPVADGAATDRLPGEEGFGWRAYQLDGAACIPVFTSMSRCAESLGRVPVVSAEAVSVVLAWPDTSYVLAVNPGSQVGASLPGAQVAELARWVEQTGLPDVMDRTAPTTPAEPATATEPAARAAVPAPVVMQKVLPHAHLPYYLERGYDLVSGLVHRADQVDPSMGLPALYARLGLVYEGSPFAEADPYAHLLQWHSHSGPETGQVRVAGVKLPHGARLSRLDRAGGVVPIAWYDADTRRWLPAGDGA